MNGVECVGFAKRDPCGMKNCSLRLIIVAIFKRIHHFQSMFEIFGLNFASKDICDQMTAEWWVWNEDKRANIPKNECAWYTLISSRLWFNSLEAQESDEKKFARSQFSNEIESWISNECAAFLSSYPRICRLSEFKDDFVLCLQNARVRIDYADLPDEAKNSQ